LLLAGIAAALCRSCLAVLAYCLRQGFAFSRDPGQKLSVGACGLSLLSAVLIVLSSTALRVQLRFRPKAEMYRGVFLLTEGVPL